MSHGATIFSEQDTDSGSHGKLHMEEPTMLTQLQRLQAREISSSELLEVHLARIEDANAALGAVVALDVERAREAAKRADDAQAAGTSWGLLRGLPMTVKDTFETEGLVTTAGSPSLAEHVPRRDADAVANLDMPSVPDLPGTGGAV